jgi:hypothetical protein
MDSYKLDESYGTELLDIPAVQNAVWVLVIGYSIGCSLLFNNVAPYSMIIFYFLGLLAFYLWHTQAHYKFFWNRTCYELHKKHHWVYYPPSQFFGTEEAKRLWPVDEYNLIKANSFIGRIRHLLPGHSNIMHEGLLYVLGLSILAIAHLAGSSSNTLWCAFVGYLLMGFIANFLHSSFHVENHWLVRYSWFRDLRYLHYLHHKGDAKNNYSVLNFTFDKLQGTYITQPRPPINGYAHLMSVLGKTLIVILCWLAWQESQKLIGEVNTTRLSVPDGVHSFMEPLYVILVKDSNKVWWMLATTSAFIDGMTLFILGSFIFGRSYTGFISMAISFSLRQVCQFLIQLPVPMGMIWSETGVPSLFVTYSTHNDMFFSGHAALSIIFVYEMFQLKASTSFKIVACLIAMYEIASILALRCHWSIDVVGGVVAAIISHHVACRYENRVKLVFP